MCGDEGKGVTDDEDSHKLCNPDLLRIGNMEYFGVAMALRKSLKQACVAKLDLLEILRARTCSRVTS